jgi:endonuclease/exonuclease/phosphatase (EEP) superfamily protein YafD
MSRFLTAISVALLLALSAGGGALRAHAADDSRAQEHSGITDADACVAALGRKQDNSIGSLLPGAIRLLNWNIQKNKKSELESDMHRLADGADLILLQEATRSFADTVNLNPRYHDAFAPGYKSSKFDTGVMTVSTATPLTQCSFRYSEPWLRTPKATNVTEYSLGDREETLLVVNMHMVNFALGLSDLRKQLNEAVRVIERHEGPVIVSGDFNTWSRTRGRTVGKTLRSLDLDPISFGSDLRKRVFGNALDHVYVRGGEVVSSTSYGVESSDHNPMSVVLRFWDDNPLGGNDEVASP